MNIIEEPMILFLNKVENKNEVITIIAQTLFNNKRIVDIKRFINDVFQREAIVSTAIGDKIAIPHALSEAVETSSLVMIRLNHAVDWDGEAVETVFGIAVPLANVNNEHLKILSNIARKMVDQEFRNTLLNSKSKREIATILNNVE